MGDREDMDAPPPVSFMQIPRQLFRDGYLHLESPPVRARSGEARFTMLIPEARLADSSTRALVQAEYKGPGYEHAERALIDRLIRSDDLFVDVGAHWGIVALHAATAGAGVRVLAVEPEPENLTILLRNVAHNGLARRVTVVAAAADAVRGRGWLRRNTAMGHHLFADSSRAGTNAIEVETVTVDWLVNKTAAQPARAVWLKIDVEGREFRVLQGAAGLLAAGRLAGVLWEAMAGGQANPDVGAIRQLLSEHGLRTYRVSETNRLSMRSGEAPAGLIPDD